MVAVDQDVLDGWARIAEPDCSIVLEVREQPLAASDINALLAKAPFTQKAAGNLQEVRAALADLPQSLQLDIASLVERFMALMQVDAVRVRVEGVTSNACKKVHADYTDVRLITTYAGPGTDYAPHGDADCCLEQVPTGAVALFKGRLFAPNHAACMHRSPPIEGTEAKRLVLVIDTPDRDVASA
jgi:hypothetical protein